MRHRVAVPALTAGLMTVLALGAAACGRDEDAAARTAIAESLGSQQSGFQLTDDQARCAADGLVDRIGVDRLQEAGVLTDDLESSGSPGPVTLGREDSEAAAEVMDECADLRGIFTSALPEQLPARSRECVEERLSDAVLRDYVAATFRDEGAQGERALTATLRDCVRVSD